MKTILSTLAVNLTLLVSLALPACAGVIIPASLWGAGQGYAEGIVPNSSLPYICYVGYSAGNPSCVLNTNSNRPPTPQSPYTGTAYAALDAFVDGNGAHLTAAGDSSGSSSAAEAQGDVGFGDVEINNSSSAEKFQLTFHLDAELYSRSQSSAQITLTFYQIYAGNPIFTKNLSDGGAGSYLFIDQDITTPLVTVAANSSLSWYIDLNGLAGASTSPGFIYPAGLPQAFLDAGDTLSITQLSVFDASGNPLPQSALSSMDGYNNTNANAPEPATGFLFASAGTLLVVAGRFRYRRRSQSHCG